MAVSSVSWANRSSRAAAAAWAKEAGIASGDNTGAFRPDGLITRQELAALLTRYEQTYDLASVKEAAEAAGMSKPSSGQITYIDLGSPDSATVYRSGADGFFSKIADTVDGWLQAAVEYFR